MRSLPDLQHVFIMNAQFCNWYSCVDAYSRHSVHVFFPRVWPSLQNVVASVGYVDHV